MINLLPIEEIQKLREERDFKITLHFSFFLFLFLLSFYLILFSIKAYFSGILQSEEILYKKEESFLDLELEKKIKTYNDLLAKINSFENQKIYLFPILEEVSKETSEKISFSDFNIELKKGGIFVSLFGISQDREALLEFIKVLKEKYSEVSYSQESLLKQNNINFSINFKVK